MSQNPVNRLLPDMNFLGWVTFLFFCWLQFISKGILKNLLSVEQRPISLEEAKTAKEVLLTSTSLIVQGVTEWDEDIINNGEVCTLLLSSLACWPWVSDDYRRHYSLLV
jgi:hypothetical protein